ncbi:MAG: hypothetical protein ACKV0T_23710 [Planctomycetales bacterium]
MSRKSAVITVGLALAVTVTAATALWMLSYQPGFYRTALQNELPPEERRDRSKRFVQATLRLVDEIRNEEQWSEEFAEPGVNSWLADELPTKYAEWLPEGIAAPRVQFEQGALQIAFQAKRDYWSGVVSARVRAWVAGPNELALEIQSLKAGLIPIPLDDAIDSIVEEMNRQGWRLEWKQSSGKDVLVVWLDRLGSSGDEPRPVLEGIELLPGRLRVSGSRERPTATRTAERDRK